MNINPSFDPEKNYNRIKQTLMHLKYNYPLGIESVPLVDKLLKDLVKTTEAFKIVQTEKNKVKNELQAETDLCLPLRNENMKLMKENNDLHREIILLKEMIANKAIATEQAITQLETEKNEVQFLIKQKDIHIKDIENESEGLRKKLNELIGKLYIGAGGTSVVNSENSNKIGLPNADKILFSVKKTVPGINIIGKKMELELSNNLLPNEIHKNETESSINVNSISKKFAEELRTTKINKEDWANDLKLADERADKFIAEIKKLKDNNENLEGKIAMLANGISIRDVEIKRLQQSAFLGEDNKEELKMKYQSESLKITNEKLTAQIDFLNKESHRLAEANDFHSHRCREEEVRRLDKKVIGLRKEREGLKKRLEQFEKIFNSNRGEMKGSSCEDMEKVKLEASTKEEYFALKDEIAQKDSAFNIEKMSLLQTRERQKEELKVQEKKIKSVTSELDDMIKKNQQLTAELNMLHGRDMICNKDVEERSGEEEKKNPSVITGPNLGNLKELQIKNSGMINEIRALKEHVFKLGNDNKNLSEDLKIEKKKFEETVKAFDKELNAYKSVKVKFSEFEEREKRFQNENIQLDRENKLLKAEIKNINEIIAGATAEMELERQNVKMLKEDKKKLIERLESNSEDLISIEDKMKNSKEFQRELDIEKKKNLDVNKQLLATKAESDKILSEKSAFEFEIKKKNLEVSKANETTERLKIEAKANKSEISRLTCDLEKLRDEYLSVQRKLCENASMELNNNLIETKGMILKEKEEKEKFRYNFNDLNEKFFKLTVENQNLSSKASQLTKLLTDAEKTKDEQQMKIREESIKCKSFENELIILKERERKMSNDISVLVDENRQLKNGISSIDHNFDNLSNQLDMKTEEISKLTVLNQNLKQQNDELNKKLSIQLSKANVDSSKIAQWESELKEYKAIFPQMENEISQLKTTLLERNKEIQGMTFDIHNLQNENQAMIEDLKRLTKENEKLNMIKSQLEKNSEYFQHKTRNNEIDFNDMSENYKEICMDNERLKQNLQLFADENRAAARHIEMMENTLGKYKSSDLTKEFAKLEGENQSLQEKITELVMQKESFYHAHSNFEDNLNHFENIIAEERKKVTSVTLSNHKLREEINNLRDENKKVIKMINDCKDITDLKGKVFGVAGKYLGSADINKLLSGLNETPSSPSSDEDNGILKRLVNDLSGQVDELRKELKTVREENTRLMSDRSSGNVLVSNERNMSSVNNESDS